MLPKDNLISYAMDFASYLISKVENIDKIIIHGSVVREDYDEESDIDLFIEVLGKNTEGKIKNALENYYKTNRYKEWELKGVKNPISIIVGRLDSKEWKDLKRAILNTGILLYGKYKAKAEKIYHYTLLSFENIKPDKKRISIFRKLFGFTRAGRKYLGLTEKMNALRIGKGVLLVPIEYTQKLKNYFQKEKIPLRLYDFWSDEKFS
ncbi:nucleotidyltransferase domain-containing protein [Candidatus Pacearchaeota archaeon]|nr:nucleotidyltransferase domain-containing protein [Candidatus Pacearchaeota archaeon]